MIEQAAAARLRGDPVQSEEILRRAAGPCWEIGAIGPVARIEEWLQRSGG